MHMMHRNTTMEREQRHRAIEHVLSAGPVASQEALAAALAARGIQTTQATLSRDLRDLGVLKGPAGYVLPGARSAGGRATREAIASSSVARVVARYVYDVRAGVGQMVLKTNPGEAQLVALELDRFPPSGVIGTVAGDDTIFVAVNTLERVLPLCKEFATLAGLDREGRTRKQAGL